MKTIHALELAQVILSLYPDQGISPMKLQKLAYYAKVWLLVTQQQPHSIVLQLSVALACAEN